MAFSNQTQAALNEAKDAELARLRGAIEYALEDDGMIPRATSACRKVLRAALSSSPAGDEVVVKRELLKRILHEADRKTDPFNELRAILGKE